MPGAQESGQAERADLFRGFAPGQQAGQVAALPGAAEVPLQAVSIYALALTLAIVHLEARRRCSLYGR